MNTPGGRQSSPEYGCAKCRYPITGLDGSICPECGSNLNRIGVRGLSGMPLAQALVTRRVVLAIVVFIAAILLLNLNPLPVLYSVRYEKRINIDGTPADRYIIESRGRSWSEPVTPTEIQVQFVPDPPAPPTHVVEVQPDLGIYTIISPGSEIRRMNGQFDAAAAIRWLNTLPDQYLTDDNLKRALAQTVAELVALRAEVVSSGVAGRATIQGRYERTVHDGLANLAWLAMAFVVWLILCRRFASRAAMVAPLSSIQQRNG